LCFLVHLLLESRQRLAEESLVQLLLLMMDAKFTIHKAAVCWLKSAQVESLVVDGRRGVAILDVRVEAVGFRRDLRWQVGLL